MMNKKHQKWMLTPAAFLHGGAAWADERLSREEKMFTPDDIGDDMSLLSTSDYSEELVAIVLLAILVLIVRSMLPTRHRMGCTFLMIFAFLLLYGINKFL